MDQKSNSREDGNFHEIRKYKIIVALNCNITVSITKNIINFLNGLYMKLYNVC